MSAKSGYRKLDDGTELVGRAVHVAPEAWVHVIFAPLDASQIATLETEVGHAIPRVYKDWLGRSNGLHLFCGALSLDGLRTDYSRRPDVYQPYGAEVANVLERPSTSDDRFFVGGYDWDGSLLFIAPNGAAGRCDRTTGETLNEWPDFATMLVSEADRLSKLHDDRGRLRDDVTTLPMPVPQSD